jgi:hypothetical protein
MALTLLASQTGQSPDIRRELEQFEQRLAATWKQGDCDAWGAMLAEDWSVIHLNGEIMAKSTALKMCRESRPAFEVFLIDEVNVRPHGDSAVVTGRTTVKLAGASDAETIRLRFSDFFVRKNGRWLVAGSHATRIVP